MYVFKSYLNINILQNLHLMSCFLYCASAKHIVGTLELCNLACKNYTGSCTKLAIQQHAQSYTNYVPMRR